MRFSLAIVLAFACLTLPSVRVAGVRADGTTDLQSLLPPGARLLSREDLPGDADTVAIAYQAPRLSLLVARVVNGSAVTSATRPLSGEFRSWGRSSVRDVVEVSVRGAKGADRICAYRYAGTGLRMAIDGRANGCTAPGERAETSPAKITLVIADTAHQGSVRYATIFRYVWSGSQFVLRWHHHVPDYAAASLPVPNASVRVTGGNVVMLRLEVARTPQQQETGLMYIHQLDPDTGMIFVWDHSVLDSFWMDNTYVPLSIAFLSPQGSVQEIQDMQPLTTTLHVPLAPYRFAIEANLGFFRDHGIRVGDRFALTLTSQVHTSPRQSASPRPVSRPQAR